MKCALAGLIAAMLALTVLAHAQQSPSEPEGYRTDNYRAPVPTTLAGARVLATEQAEAIWRSGSGVFVDVLPRPPKPPNLPAGTIWRDRPRFNIPGSIWLPDTGYGTLAAATEDYLRNGLARASGGNSARLPVIYCQADCWMSWNAASGVVLRLFRRRLVPRRHGWMAAGQLAAVRFAAGAAGRRGEGSPALVG